MILYMQHNTYLPHIDILKGIAILLVIMGHIFIFGLDYARSPIFSMICSIHMPLFVMLSGILSARPIQFTGKKVIVYWTKKSIQLLLPLIIIPYFYALTAEISTEQMLFGLYHGGYWFTFSLFLMFIPFFFFRWTVIIMRAEDKPYRSFYLATISIGIVIVIDTLLTKSSPEMYNTLSWRHINWLYPYLLFGYFVGRFYWLEDFIRRPLVVALSFLLFMALLYIEYNGYKLWKGYPMSIAGLIFVYGTVYTAIQKYDALSHPIYRALKLLGQASLPIYLTHYFFLFSMPHVSEYILSITSKIRALTWEIVVVTLGSLAVLIPTLLVVYLVRQNRILSLILYGEQRKQ